MPRMARVKDPNAIYHVMARSINEVMLFKDDEDKKAYLSEIKEYQELFKFRVYGYCLMDTHLHLLIDTNGADISQIMHGINFSYAGYFNHRHKRHGHLFADRFRSKIVKNEQYLLAASAYIHNNPMDIPQYEGCPEKYQFSSLAVYIGLRQDPYELVEDSFVKSLFGNNPKAARERYIRFVYVNSNKVFKEHIEFENQPTEYRSERKILVRNFTADKIIEFVASKMGIQKRLLYIKGSRESIDAKALVVVLMRGLCNFKCSKICSILGNITQMRVSTLCGKGLRLMKKDEKYQDIIEEFISCYSA